MQRLIALTTKLAGLFHDIGKENEWFQGKLNKKARLSDPIRHEFISYLILKNILQSNHENRWMTDVEFLHLLSNESLFGATYAEAFRKLSDNAEHYKGISEKAISEDDWLYQTSLQIDLPPASGEEGAFYGLQRALMLIVLSHHKLPHGRILLYDENGVEKTDTVLSQRDHLTIPAKPNEIKKVLRRKIKSKLEKDSYWLSSISVCAKQMLRILDYGGKNFPKKFDLYSFVYGRHAMMLADHTYSQKESKKAVDQSKSYANTKKRNGELNQTLSDHLVGVGRMSHLSYSAFTQHNISLPCLEEDDLPELIREPSERRNSPFRWQVDAFKMTKSHFTKNDVNEGGFFGLLMAGTGTGKTRAIPLLMNAVNNGKLRYSLGLGLRTLTLQSGDEYRKDMGLPEDSVGVVIGSEVAEKLHQIKDTNLGLPDDEDNVRTSQSLDIGTEADDIDLSAVVKGTDNSRYDHSLPSLFRNFFKSGSDSCSLLEKPLIVCTVDTLMPLADARRGRHLSAWARVITSDIVLDEIDDYSPEDLVAISRLVFYIGAYGRKLLISSATISPSLAESLYQSYLEGYRCYSQVTGSPMTLSVAWYSEKPGVGKIKNITDTSLFSAEHKKRCSAMIDALQGQPAKRRGDILDVYNPVTPAVYFDTVIKGMQKLHKSNYIIDNKTGRRISCGVVRWNNVKPSIKFVEYLTRSVPQDTEIRVIAYNGSLTQATRFYTEHLLDNMLKRKGKIDPILSNEVIRDVVDNSIHKDVIIIVSTTSMEEVGRDHDFDWAIVEPGSVRSIIQMAGRIRRHRDAIRDTPVNLYILQNAYKEFSRLWGETRKEQNPFAYPGVETPISPPRLKYHLDIQSGEMQTSFLRSKSKDADVVYNKGDISEKIDAREIIEYDKNVKSILCNAEDDKLQHYLYYGFYGSEGQKEGSNIASWYQTVETISCAYHPETMRFRRNSTTIPFIIEIDGDEIKSLIRHHFNGTTHYTTTHSHQTKQIVLDDKQTQCLLPKIKIQEAFNKLDTRIFGEEGTPLRAKLSLLAFEIMANDNDHVAVHPVLGSYKL